MGKSLRNTIDTTELYSVYVIVIPCMQRLHQFYQPEPKGVARGRELIKTYAACACMVQLIYRALLDCKLTENVSMEGLQ